MPLVVNPAFDRITVDRQVWEQGLHFAGCELRSGECLKFSELIERGKGFFGNIRSSKKKISNKRSATLPHRWTMMFGT